MSSSLFQLMQLGDISGNCLISLYHLRQQAFSKRLDTVDGITKLISSFSERTLSELLRFQH